MLSASPAWAKRLYAYFRLALRALLLHPLRELFTPQGRKGPARFLANYAPEGLLPYSAEERARLASFMTCIACGLCDLVCPIPARAGREKFPGPSLVARAYSRATPDLVKIGPALAYVDACAECRLCEAVCPRRVPLVEMFEFSKRKLAQQSELGQK